MLFFIVWSKALRGHYYFVQVSIVVKCNENKIKKKKDFFV